MYQRKWTDILVVGDQIKIPLGDLGTFTATAQKIKDNKILFLFDDCVTKRQMNEKTVMKADMRNLILKNGLKTICLKCFLKS